MFALIISICVLCPIELLTIFFFFFFLVNVSQRIKNIVCFSIGLRLTLEQVENTVPRYATVVPTVVNGASERNA